jgi:hypothetical protein
MKIEQGLTKENFFDRMYKQYPISYKKFCDWIDEYKKAVDWKELFNNTPDALAPKFHEIPHAFQFGIWHTYALQSENNEWYNEQLYDYETLQKAIEAFFEYSESWEAGNRCEFCGMAKDDCICDDKTQWTEKITGDLNNDR